MNKIPPKIQRAFDRYFKYQIRALKKRDMFPGTETIALYADQMTRQDDTNELCRLEDDIYHWWKAHR
jgi:hypothetical protein